MANTNIKCVCLLYSVLSGGHAEVAKTIRLISSRRQDTTQANRRIDYSSYYETCVRGWSPLLVSGDCVFAHVRICSIACYSGVSVCCYISYRCVAIRNKNTKTFREMTNNWRAITRTMQTRLEWVKFDWLTAVFCVYYNALSTFITTRPISNHRKSWQSKQ